jgi:beta-glucosidase
MTDTTTFDAPAGALPLTDKAALGSGASFWSTQSAAGLPAAVLSDGPHGVRAQLGAADHLGIAPSAPATCFPPASGIAQSWDPDLVRRIGAALAVEARHHGVGVLLGPGINIRRDPRGGRNFEYYSEDPYLTGELGAAWVDGLQGGGVGASLKHFAANNAELDRMRSSSQVDPRALREIYLRAFERVVTGARPWTVMCSYNKINGVLASENRWLLTDVLRGEWGFDGAVVSDWGAVRDRVAAVAAGLDLQMPGGSADADAAVVAAVEEGLLDESAVDAAANNVLTLLRRVADGRGASPAEAFDADAHHDLAREAAGRSVVLLKNDGALLPLAPGAPLTVIGQFAARPRFQGGGSSHVAPTRVDVPLEEIQSRAGEAMVVHHAGFDTTGEQDADALRAEAVEAADAAGTVVLFLGLDARQESEGFDREDIELPADQLQLLREVVAVQPRTVVVLSHGGVLRLAEVDALAPAVLDGALLGQAAGSAIADALFGVVNPSGRLSETVPARLQDAPSFLNFPGEFSSVVYGESLCVGYRGYDARDIAVTYPFGHGLSYTSFGYDDLRLAPDADGLTARVTVTNTGERAGREVVQLYVALDGSRVRRAPRELKAFATVDLEPGRSAEVELRVRRRDLAYWDLAVDSWVVEGGQYTVAVGASSRDLRLQGHVEVEGDEVRAPLTPESTLGELMAHPVAGPLLAGMRGEQSDLATEGDALGTDMARMMASIPMERMVSMSGGQFDRAGLDQLLRAANGG